ncbi:MAG: hypothetical protein GSR79_00395 [Desulfurococcales archaeon]|nr:hypothetical protein [Desulfurococcales archaeon]
MSVLRFWMGDFCWLDRGVLWFLLFVLLLPLRMVFLVVGFLFVVYFLWRRLFLLGGVVVVSLVLVWFGVSLGSLVLLGGLLVAWGLFRRRFLLSFGFVLGFVVVYFALGDVVGRGYLGGLRESLGSGGSTGVLGFHLVLLVSVFVYGVSCLDWFAGSRVAGYFRENPHGFPALLFVLLIVVAAVYLGLGDEGVANVFAELAYYSLVLSVSLAVSLLGAEGEEGDGEGDGSS